MKLNNILDQPTHVHIVFMLVWQSSGQALLNGTRSAVQQQSTSCWNCVPWPLHGCPKEKRAVTKTQRKMDIQLVWLLVVVMVWFCLFVLGFVCPAFFKHEETYFEDWEGEKIIEISCIHLLTFSNCSWRGNCYFD